MTPSRKRPTPSASGRQGTARVGASPITHREKRKWNWGFLRITFKVGALLGLLVGLVVGFQALNPRAYLDQFMNRPIAGVSVESEFKFVSQVDAQAIVAARLPKTFLELDMLGIKNALEANPWVDKVMISRNWPDKLLVHIEEQKPIARWGTSGFLNLRGEVIKIDNVAALSSLPVFVADERYAKEVMQQYLLVKNIMALSNLKPQVLALDNTMAWTVEFNNGLTIKLGREKAIEKLQNISKILRGELAREMKHMRSIDMRYENGFAVAWKDAVAPQVVVRQPVSNQVQTDTSELSAE